MGNNEEGIDTYINEEGIDTYIRLVMRKVYAPNNIDSKISRNRIQPKLPKLPKVPKQGNYN